MDKTKVDQILKDYIRNNLSPSKSERQYVTDRYEELKNKFEGKTFQSGSYARYTSTTPVNDLDVIFILPETIADMRIEKLFTAESLDINNIINSLAENLRKEYPPNIVIKPQVHSVGIFFGSEDDFSIDVVPAIPLASGLFEVPESSHISRMKRQHLYKLNSKVQWIKSDPKGYIEDCSNLDQNTNGNFRKITKFIKKWSKGCKKVDTNFRLKSFHLEQIINRILKENPNISCLESITYFFENIHSYLEKPQFPDKADPNRYIDSYISQLSQSEKEVILKMSEIAKNKLKQILSCTEDKILLFIEELLWLQGQNQERYFYPSKTGVIVSMNPDLQKAPIKIPRPWRH